MNTEPKLSLAEFSSLKDVARGGLLKRSIPDEHREKLLSLKYIEQKLGGDVATRAGHIRVAKGK